MKMNVMRIVGIQPADRPETASWADWRKVADQTSLRLSLAIDEKVKDLSEVFENVRVMNVVPAGSDFPPGFYVVTLEVS